MLESRRFTPSNFLFISIISLLTCSFVLSAARSPMSICCVVDVLRLAASCSMSVNRAPKSAFRLSICCWTSPSNSPLICVNRESTMVVTSADLCFLGFVAEAASCIIAPIISSRDLSQLIALLCSVLLGVRCNPPAIMRVSRLIRRVVQLNSNSRNECLVLVGV